VEDFLCVGLWKCITVIGSGSKSLDYKKKPNNQRLNGFFNMSKNKGLSMFAAFFCTMQDFSSSHRKPDGFHCSGFVFGVLVASPIWDCQTVCNLS
jgi:hypothetical protein